MPIAYPAILDLKSDEETVAWKDRDAMLYALGIGLGSDPLNGDELPFVYENGLKAVPTFATVLAMTEGYGRLIARSGINFARADGGFGGSSEGEAEPHKVPDRPADLSLDFPTRPDQALLYRLSGDRNPLHADPAFAKMVGFDRPILHGLCTFGITCRAVMQGYAEFDPARVKSHQARFSAPVFPGETVSVDLWRDGDVVSFEARVRAREAVVIKNGRSVVG